MWGVIRNVMPTSLRSTVLMTLARFVESREGAGDEGDVLGDDVSPLLVVLREQVADEGCQVLFAADARRTAPMAGPRPVGQVTLPPDPAGDQPGTREGEGVSRTSPASSC